MDEAGRRAGGHFVHSGHSVHTVHFVHPFTRRQTPVLASSFTETHPGNGVTVLPRFWLDSGVGTVEHCRDRWLRRGGDGFESWHSTSRKPFRPATRFPRARSNTGDAAARRPHGLAPSWTRPPRTGAFSERVARKSEPDGGESVGSSIPRTRFHRFSFPFLALRFVSPSRRAGRHPRRRGVRVRGDTGERERRVTKR